MLTRCCAIPEPKGQKVSKRLAARARRVAESKPVNTLRGTPKKKTKDEDPIFDKPNDMWKDMTDTFDLDEE